jgi:hypothetical protein
MDADWRLVLSHANATGKKPNTEHMCISAAVVPKGIRKTHITSRLETSEESATLVVHIKLGASDHRSSLHIAYPAKQSIIKKVRLNNRVRAGYLILAPQRVASTLKMK